MKTTMMAAVLVLGFAAGCNRPTVSAGSVPCQTEAAAPSTAAVAAAPAPAPVETSTVQPKPTKTAPVVTKAQAPERASAELAVKRLVVATGVKDRQPEGEGTIFRQSETEKVYAFVEVENKSGSPSEVVVSFEAPGGKEERGNVKLAVGESARWRTWAFTKNARTPGAWTAIVRDTNGRVLAKAPFEVSL